MSPSVVSYVLNNSQPVSAEKRERVLLAVAELGYEPSRAARSLRMHRTGTAGVLIPYLVNATQASLAAAIEQALAERDYLAVICATGGREARQHSYFRMLYASRVDGLLVYPTADMRVDLEGALLRGLPVVSVLRELPFADGLRGDAVLVDNHAIVEEATETLLDLGHRRIALVTLSLDSISGPDRVAGYRAALGRRGLAVDPTLVCAGEGSVDGGRVLAAAALRLEPPPTALVATAGPQTVGAVQAIQAAGLRIPDDISVIGANPSISIYGPTLSIWDYQTTEVGRRAVDLFMRRLAAGPSEAPLREVLRPTLKAGGSVAPPSISDKRRR